MKKRAFILALLALLVWFPLEAVKSRDYRFSFGIAADIQYADKETKGLRRYREAIDKLAVCIADWNTRPLAFTIQLGDIIDGNENKRKTLKDLERVLDVFGTLKMRSYHVIGNHCLTAGRKDLLRKLGLEKTYYEFNHLDWRFIVLDGMEISFLGWPENSENYKTAENYLKDNPEAAPYNGAIGKSQMAWLTNRLEYASKRKEKVIVFCHFPVLEQASQKDLLLWDHRKIIKLFNTYDCVAAFFSGHDHQGGYAYHNGVHHVTLQGIVEAPQGSNAYGIIDVFTDSLVVKGVGTLNTRTLRLKFQ